MIALVRKDPPAMDLTSFADQTPTCRFLSLPSELRLYIYELLLIQQDRIVPGVARRTQRFCANILRTCKQVCSEATPILYKQNTFLAHPNLLTALPSFLLVSQPHRVTLPPVTETRVANLVSRYFLHLRLDVDTRFTKDQATESFTGVEALEIEVFMASYGTCDFAALKRFEEVRGVGKAVVQGSVGDGAYARWLERVMMSEVGAVVPPFREEYIGGSRVWDAWVNGNR